MSNDLRLNSLERFTKQSPRLVLETHSSCEAPAGCIGAVLRWRNPQSGLPVVFQVAPVGEIALCVDGKPATSARVTLPLTDSVLAIHLRPAQARNSLLLVAAARDTGMWPREEAEIADLSTRADGTWRATTQPPSEDWAQPAFDDRDWPSLPRGAFRAEAVEEQVRWRYESILRRDAVPLALPNAPEIWVRKRFRVEE